MDDLHSTDFLWPAECELLHHFVSLQNEGFAWDDSECSHFCKDFFPPVKIPVVAHTPWVKQNIPILPGIYDEVRRIICIKMDAGVYEWSNSSYCLHWFCIVKKDTTSLCLVHSLELLNAVTIQHLGVTPFTEQITKQFTSCACGGTLDLYIGYDESAQLYDLSDTLQHASPHKITNGMDECGSHISRWCNSHPSTQSSKIYYSIYQWCAYSWPHVYLSRW